MNCYLCLRLGHASQWNIMLISFSLYWLTTTDSKKECWNYNFWQRISWLSQRWRTQRNAITSVNCRIPWIIESLNAYCTFWYPGKYACLSINKTSPGNVLFLGIWSIPVWSCVLWIACLQKGERNLSESHMFLFHWIVEFTLELWFLVTVSFLVEEPFWTLITEILLKRFYRTWSQIR